MKKEQPQQPTEKITDISVPYSHISEWVSAFREHGLSDVEMMEMLKCLNVTDYKEAKKTNFLGLSISEDDRKGWEATLEDGGFSKEEAEQIIGRLVPAKRTEEEIPAIKIPIQHKDSETDEIPVIRA